MTVGQLALLAGLFVVPVFALFRGFHFRTQTKVRRRVFWGVVAGHSLGMVVTVVLALFPPIWWQGGPSWRDYAVYWSMLVCSLAGALIARFTVRPADTPATPTARAARSPRPQ